MRARHRHFNPTGAGATAVFDSRFIDGLADGAGVATWTSRSGANDITQATAANRPTYETNEINGSPSVLWDGGTNDQLVFASALAYSDVSLLMVYRNNDATNGSVGWCRNDNFLSYCYFSTNFFRFARPHTNGTVEVTADRTHNLGNVFLIASATSVGSTNATAFTNGLAGTTITANIGGTFTTTGIGKYNTATQFNTEGHLGLAVLANVAWSSSLRRRCEHAAAYSFKIACN